MSNQPYNLRPRDWIPFIGQDEYEQRIIFAYGKTKNPEREEYSLTTARIRSPKSSIRLNSSAVYNCLNTVGLLGLSALTALLTLKGLDNLCNLIGLK